MCGFLQTLNSKLEESVTITIIRNRHFISSELIVQQPLVETVAAMLTTNSFSRSEV